VTQTSTENGGRFDLEWVRLGHATDAEIESLVVGGIRFSDIFEEPNYNGFAYITANFQHPGDEDGMKAYTGADKAEVATKIDALWGNRKKVAIGYIGTGDGALQAMR
jgi:hypothetical protein